MPDFSDPKKEFASTLSHSNARVVRAPKVTANTAKMAPHQSLREQNLTPRLPVPAVNDWVAQRLLKEYGAIFVAQGNVVRPPAIIFTNPTDCITWQSRLNIRRENIGGIYIELQTEAMNALLAAREEAVRKNLRITPRGTWAARRSYRDTEKIWSRRVVPGLAFWRRRGKLSAREAARIQELAPARQVKEILRLEAQGLYFSKNFSKSILYSGTAPGASQHISMLALDINENHQAAVRAILARHGWFQTVISDLPHFTYLGTTQNKLPALGLKKTVKNKRIYWTPA
ncbi:hypothetical protein [Adhaeribacter rhizoryzae]|uniref:Peptidase M15B domain-containing protein n=1 Tax=Adhaeribacter rhizoryzae TaxID=2607907 RepID=A0A5M6D778_9BACT|nr:hypothetical protein [Adhaeribacter rhizoryzae]KAA5542340.1 hypothetical protein F0145_19105 [Adhaeribacter rhizoryzae]